VTGKRNGGGDLSKDAAREIMKQALGKAEREVCPRYEATHACAAAAMRLAASQPVKVLRGLRWALGARAENMRRERNFDVPKLREHLLETRKMTLLLASVLGQLDEGLCTRIPEFLALRQAVEASLRHLTERVLDEMKAFVDGAAPGKRDETLPGARLLMRMAAETQVVLDSAGMLGDVLPKADDLAGMLDGVWGRDVAHIKEKPC
jgi:hypothetical protein